MKSSLIIDDGLPSHTYLELLDDMKYSRILLLNRTNKKEAKWVSLKKTSDSEHEVLNPTQRYRNDTLDNKVSG